MTEVDTELLRASLAKHMPAKVRAYGRDGEELRTVPVPPGRKRWQAVLGVLARVPWARLELLDRTGGLLCVQDEQAAEAEADVADAAELTGRDAQLLRLLTAAQQTVLSNRERETSIAMSAMGAAFKVLTDAIGVLAQVQRMALDTQAAAFRTAMESAPEESADLESQKMISQLAPILVAKLLAPTPAPAPTGTNGVKS